MSVRVRGHERDRHSVFDRTATAPNEVIGAWEDEAYANTWQRLQLLHSSFRAAEQAEYQSLLTKLRDIDMLFVEHAADLDRYRHELGFLAPRVGVTRP
jgi:hypothetical protein